ncbi:glycosidase [Longilinea arvoryzae]|uniref:Alpha-amylase n=1 Tax=Longilinea arvoryzae TaxID=360412 RepID=A0A0S7BH72_9CHLR|nr:alpha-amylase family glycosyl hydrolase [Longilinea arvoryzae]GAP14436.1 glycosidase [Longilinea arvoryzae]
MRRKYVFLAILGLGGLAIALILIFQNQYSKTRPLSSAPPRIESTAEITQTSVPQISKNTQPIPEDTLVNPYDETNWWGHSVFYEIFVRSYSDSNGDGIGDFNGITAKLDYLNDGDPETTSDLGITALWLMPIFPASSYHGYDVTDYLAVNPEYGTMDDFKALLDAAHERGIRIIIDFVINHTSSEHPWFQSAMSATDSPYRDYYIWSDQNPGYVGPWNETVWHKSIRGDYYYGVFSSNMPDLNFRNQAVRDEIKKITSFWLTDVGVDGFRIDGARHLIEDGEVQVNTPETHQYLKEFYNLVKSINPRAMVVGEVWDSSFVSVKYVQDQEMDMVFDFDLSSAWIEGLNRRDATILGSSTMLEVQLFPINQMATFLTNHDMNRISDQLMGDEAALKAAASLLLTASGVPFVYYGEEIGMSGSKPDEQIRTPMQWTAAKDAGFSQDGKAWIALNSDYKKKNVDLQLKDPNSLLSTYRELIQMRQKTPALLVGDYQWIDTGFADVYAAVRQFEGQVIIILINLSDSPIRDFAFDLQVNLPAGNYSVTPLLGNGVMTPITVGSNGVIKAYQPLDELSSNARLILELKPVK